MTSLFISDLHLSAGRPGVTRRFLDLLNGPARRYASLYILGDLFEAWLGDDLILPDYVQVLAAMAALSASGTRCYVQQGNRDFLLGEQFARQTGSTLLPEAHCIDLCGRNTLLLHGDTLCSDDKPYQQMRSMLRNPAWIADFLAKPPAERIEFARQLRSKSQQEVAGKSYAIMDVNPETLRQHVDAHGAQWVIHGHTHRPAVHLQQGTRRYVLGDWEDCGAWVLACDQHGCRLVNI